MSLRHNDSKHGTPRTRGRTWQRIRLQVLAEENGHQLGTPATIEPTPNSHVFSERELDNMGRRR